MLYYYSLSLNVYWGLDVLSQTHPLVPLPAIFPLGYPQFPPQSASCGLLKGYTISTLELDAYMRQLTLAAENIIRDRVIRVRSRRSQANCHADPPYSLRNHRTHVGRSTRGYCALIDARDLCPNDFCPDLPTKANQPRRFS
jgi:hypothetical protein